MPKHVKQTLLSGVIFDATTWQCIAEHLPDRDFCSLMAASEAMVLFLREIRNQRAYHHTMSALPHPIQGHRYITAVPRMFRLLYDGIVTQQQFAMFSQHCKQTEGILMEISDFMYALIPEDNRAGWTKVSDALTCYGFSVGFMSHVTWLTRMQSCRCPDQYLLQAFLHISGTFDVPREVCDNICIELVSQGRSVDFIAEAYRRLSRGVGQSWSGAIF